MNNTEYEKTDSHADDLAKLKKNGVKLIDETLDIELSDGKTKAVLVPVNSLEDIPESLRKFIASVFQKEIEAGRTYPQYNTLSYDEFCDYWFHYFAAVLLLKDQDTENWEKIFLGTYYIKPNYAGRCSHICNAGFLVNPAYRGTDLKIGMNLGKSYLVWAPKLSYTYSVFNLVFENNYGSIKIWDKLGFERIGYIKNAGKLKNCDKPIGAIMFGKDLS